MMNLNEESKSKSQRRLMTMALLHKRGKLADKYITPTIEKLAKTISEKDLLDFAETKEKKRKKDGSIGKRNAIPQKVEDKHKKKKS